MEEEDRSVTDSNVLSIYKKHITFLEENEDVLTQPDNDQLIGSMMEFDELYTNVRRPSEALVDAKVVHKLSSLTLKKSQEIGTNIVNFNQNDFAQRLRLKIFTDENFSSAAFVIKFGQKVSHLFVRSPSLHTSMKAAMDCTGPSTGMEVSLKKERQVRSKPEKLEATVQKIVLQGHNGQEETVEQKVEVMRKKFKSAWKNSGCVGVDLFSVVLNPRSFGESVENLFYFSFLVSEGKVSTCVDCDGEGHYRPLVTPVKRCQRKSGLGSSQVVVNFSMQDWRRLGQSQGDNSTVEDDPVEDVHQAEDFVSSRLQESLVTDWLGNSKDEEGLLNLSFYSDFNFGTGGSDSGLGESCV